MDADDTISADNGRKLQALARQEAAPSLLGYIMQVHCPGAGADGDADVTVVDHVKLIRNRPDLRFEGRIHEQILPAIRRAGGAVAWTDLYVVHSGYDHSPEGQARKRQRDLRLLHLELHERPDHPFTLFNLGMTYADSGHYAEAVTHLHESIRHAGTGESHLRKAYALLVYARMQLGQPEAAGEVCDRGLQLIPLDAELRFRKALLLHETGRLAEAAATYRHLLEHREARHFTSLDRGITGFKARQNLAVVYTDLGESEKAEEQWRQVVAEMPGYRPGWRGLGEALLKQGKQDALAALVQQLLADGKLRGEGLLLQGQAAVARGECAAARRWLEQAVAENPTEPEFQQALCRFLFEQGTPAEAEAALTRLVHLVPQDAAALHNLGTVRLRVHRYAEAIEAFRQSLRYRPNSAATCLHLGSALKESGQLAAARAVWEEALRLNPADSAILHALEEIPEPAGA
jgi:tetratricopeptide (TPR) repeat protein